MAAEAHLLNGDEGARTTYTKTNASYSIKNGEGALNKRRRRRTRHTKRLLQKKKKKLIPIGLQPENEKTSRK
jgi:hypothetical protein